MKKYAAIYARRSILDRDNNSLSIDSQIAEGIKSLEDGEEWKTYVDEGRSGKDILHRPAFLQMMADAKDGLISKIIVKKYDRFGRSIRDCLNVMSELDEAGVGVFSLTEPFNTTTKEGRLMRNQILSFAEFERETIAARCADSYNIRSISTGFKQGGKPLYGYTNERREVNGKKGSVLIPDEYAHLVQEVYKLYTEPNVSLQDLVRYYQKNGIRGDRIEKTFFSRMLENPVYVKADVDVYRHLVSKGLDVVDDVSEYKGINGVFRHRSADGGYFAKLGYHEGIIEPDVWLAVQDKKQYNRKIPNVGFAKKSYLVGLTKCKHCGYAVNYNYSYNKNNKNIKYAFYRDSGAFLVNGCVSKNLKIRPDEVEKIVFKEMKKRLDSLVIAKKLETKPDVEISKIKTEIAHVDDEIRKLLDKLADADEVLFKYIQERIAFLHNKKNECEEKLRAKSRHRDSVDAEPLQDPLRRWDSLTIDEKNKLAKTIIEVVYLSDSTGVEVVFKI